MFYKALRTLDLKNAPDDSATPVARVFKNDVGELLTQTDDQAWLELVFRDDLLADRRGWTRLTNAGQTNLVEADHPDRRELNLWAFLKGCVDAEIWVNQQPGIAPFFLSADYLIALASIETGLKNLPNRRPDSDGVGPFQLSSQHWDTFVTEAGSQLGFDDDDRDDPLDQIFGAAYHVAQTIKAISNGIKESDLENNDKETSGISGPYVPSYVDVLIANITNPGTAIRMRIEKHAERGGQSVEAVLRTEFSPEETTRIISYRSRLLWDDTGRKPETIDGAYLRIAKVLDEEFRNAFDLMKEHTPEDLPQSDGNAPWLDIALREKKKWEGTLKNETTHKGKAKVIEYFRSIGFKTKRADPWCAAFVGYCMIEAGAPFEDMVVKAPARAASWKTWGNTSIPLGQEDIPVGAVVVFSPEKGSGRSGHVGFFVRHLADKGQIEAVSGNQSDTVTLAKFSKSKVVALRWHSPATSETNDEASSETSNATDGQLDTLLKFIGKFESNNNPNAYFRHANNRNNPKLTSMTLNEVFQFQRSLRSRSPSTAAGEYQFISPTLKGLVAAGHAQRTDLFDQTTQRRLATALLVRRSLGKFLTGSIAIDDFALNLAKEWASMPITRDVMRGGRRIRRGQSYYAGDGLNAAHASVPDFLTAIRSARSA